MSGSHSPPSWLRFLSIGVAIIAILLGVFFVFRPNQSRDNTPESAVLPESKASVFPTISLSVDNADNPEIAAVVERSDAAKDENWNTEVLAEAAKNQLDMLAKRLTVPSTITAATLSEFMLEDVSCPTLRPNNLAEVYSDDAISVFRSAHHGSTNSAADQTFRGIHHVTSALRESLGILLQAKHIRTKFKVTGVTQEVDSFSTVVDVQASGVARNGRAQINATWSCRWKTTDDPKLPKIASIVSKEFEEIRPIRSPAIRFSDQTLAVLGTTNSYHQQLNRGADYWSSRLELDFGVDINGNQGIAIGDVNGDGLEDIYVCQPGGLPNRLYVRSADGKLNDTSSESGADWMDLTRSALILDLDNDADQDLVVCQGWYVLIMLNSGAGRFQVSQQIRCRGGSYSIVSADYDNDGDLDIFVCGRDPDPTDAEFAGVLGSPIPYHDANNGAANMLLQNDGLANFRDVTNEVGLDENNRRFSYAAAWADYDNDGDMDLYVANDFGRNNLYKNTDGRFSDIAAELGVEDISAGMSVTWGDYDNDNRLDVYVSNMYSSAGNRIAYQRQFREGASDKTLSEFRRHARGNSLFQNSGNPVGQWFRDVSESSGVTMGRWAWGSKFVDLNNDSREDLYVANGFITTEDTGDL